MTPKTIGIIMDGNRRWAKAEGLPSLQGHRVGLDKIKEVLHWAKDAGIENVIVYALSTENLKRTEEEVAYYLKLIKLALKDFLKEFIEEGARMKCVGDLERLPKDIRELIEDAEEKTKTNTNLTFYVALAYGGRAEILNAVKKLEGKEITEESFEKALWTSGMPDPDLIIRTGGEKRLSNFLPWQSVYSELFFTDTYWPAFTKEEFLAILEEYGKRERRFGK